MFPAVKDMHAVDSGTGVFYQAMPAVGADGKNIMKLIPVQMVDGLFVQTKRCKPRTDPTPHKAVTVSAPVPMVKRASLNPFCSQQVVRKQVSYVNASPHQVGLDLPNSLNKHPLVQQTVNVMANVPLMETHAADCEMSVRLSSHLPVTVKSPALPRGQYLQIPPDAQVRTVPASELPPGIKNQIFTSSANSSPGSGLPSVVYVSPITTVNQSVSPPSDPALRSLKLLSKSINKTSCGPPSKGSLKMIPKVSQRPNSPIKWTIEEDDTSKAQALVPLVSPTVTSEILRAVAEREKAKHSGVIAKPVSQPSPGKCGQGQQNALLMCNGKVFFVAKKGVSSTAATKSYEFSETIVPSSQQSLESIAPQTKQDVQIIIPDEADEVIDLCDDDAQDDPSQQAAPVSMSAVTPLDEDNVIFVSYIPPKSEEMHRVGTSSSNSGDEVSADRGRKPDQSMSVPTVRGLARVCGSAVMHRDMHHDKGSDINSQQSTSTHQLESIGVDERTGSAADTSSSAMCSAAEKDSHKMEISVTPPTCVTLLQKPKTCQKPDHLLRQIFGITADVKICLQRIDEASAGSVPELRSIRSEERHREPTGRLTETELFLRDPYRLQETDCVKTPIELTEQELPADSTPSPHSHIGLLKCSNFILNTKPLSALNKRCHSGQSSLKETSCDVETEPGIGYVEPIDEDFLSTDENYIPDAQYVAAWPQTQTQTHVDLSSNTRRMVRKRKRPTCPCCIPGTPGTAVKAGAKSQEPEQWAWTTSKKGGRTRAVSRDVTTSVRFSCLTPKSTQNHKTYEVPACDSLSGTSMDCSELEQQEQIQRFKELLKENEAALELMRNSMS